MTNKKDDMKSKKAERPKGKLDKRTPVSGSPKEIVKALKGEDKLVAKLKTIPKAMSGPRMISTKLIHPNPYNCNFMAPSDREALKSDMKQMIHPSMMDPVRVRKDGKEFEVIDGEHRHGIALELGWPEIPCTIFDISQESALLWNFRINAQRGTHDPTKEAVFFKYLKDEIGLTQTRIGELLNMDRSVVSRRISILNIDKEIMKTVDTGETPVSVLEVVAQAPTKSMQKEMLRDYKDGGYTVEDLQDTVNEEKEEIHKEQLFQKMMKTAEFPKCPTCGEKADGPWFTEPYVKHDSDSRAHIWNPLTGLTKQKEDNKQRAADTGHPDQSRVLSVFRHMMAPTEIVAKARKNFADFAEVVYNQCDDVKLGFSPHTEDGDWDGDFDAILTDGNYGSPTLQITSDQGELQVVLESKAYGSGELTKVIVSQPSPYEKGGIEKAEKLLSLLIEGKLTFKKLAKQRDKKQKLKLKLPKPLPGMIQPSEKEIFQLEEAEVHKALARFCNHGKHGKINFPQEGLFCGGYSCTEGCLVKATLEEAGIWKTKAMGDASCVSKIGETEYTLHTDKGTLPIPSKVLLLEKFRKLLVSGFKVEASTGGSMPVKVGGKEYLVGIEKIDRKLAGQTSRCPECGDVKNQKLCGAGYSFCKKCELHHRPTHCVSDLRAVAQDVDTIRDIGNAIIKGDPKDMADLMKRADLSKDRILPLDIQEVIRKEFGTFLLDAFEKGHSGNDVWLNIGKQKIRIQITCLSPDGFSNEVPDEKKLRWEPKKKSRKKIEKMIEDAGFRKLEGLAKCTAYEDKKYCNGCVNGNKMESRECWADPKEGQNLVTHLEESEIKATLCADYSNLFRCNHCIDNHKQKTESCYTDPKKSPAKKKPASIETCTTFDEEDGTCKTCIDGENMEHMQCYHKPKKKKNLKSANTGKVTNCGECGYRVGSGACDTCQINPHAKDKTNNKEPAKKKTAGKKKVTKKKSSAATPSTESPDRITANLQKENCLGYADNKRCNKCIDNNSMTLRKCYKNPSKKEMRKRTTNCNSCGFEYGSLSCFECDGTPKAKRPKPNDCGVYETFDEVITWDMKVKKPLAYASIELVDTGNGWAVGSHSGHRIGSLAGRGSPCSLDKNPHKNRDEALLYAITEIVNHQDELIKRGTDGETTNAQLANARKMLKWCAELCIKENLTVVEKAQKRITEKKATKKKTTRKMKGVQ